MSERCEVCDRPKANTSDEITPETCGIGVVDRPIDDSISQCDAHRVKWRARALTAEQSLAVERQQNALLDKQNGELSGDWLHARLELAKAEQSLATANETIRGLTAALTVEHKACLTEITDVLCGTHAGGSAIFDRLARVNAALAPRNAAERGEAKGESEP